jgi:predicted aspartyl protease
MRIYKPIKFKGARRRITKQSLIDTGANISLIPIELARHIGAWRTNQNVNVKGVHGQQRPLPLGKIGIFFPDLGNKGGYFLVAVSDVEEVPIIGMDVLKPLGINIDTKTEELSIKHEVWEAFKTLSGIGIAFFLGVKIIEKLFEEEQ